MMRFFRIYGMSVVYTLFVLYMSITPLPVDFILPDFNLKDKVLHGGAYVVFALILCLELYRQRYSFTEKKMWGWGMLYPILYGGFIEIIQENFFPPRQGEWSDWLADILGVMIGFFIAKWLYPKFVKPEAKGLYCK